ncbi:DHS-like NAD/FAD-binding domain-containing protein [Bisporella sp. PMI_857]|nr:DHS-like NAD/FAD-binding domain-containing protein [Bisporella sp. PMI_857]
MEHNVNDIKLRKITEALRSKRKIVVIAGAGISVSAGIPDFRSSTGLFTTLKSQHKTAKSSGKHLFDASVYRNNNSTKDFHDMVRELSHLTKNAAPTPFHHMLATLAEEGRLLRLYTQNVDGIDTAIQPLATTVPLNKKGPWPKTVQLHGGLGKMVCSKCGHLSDFDGALFEGPEAPSCTECITTDGVRIAGGLRSHGIGCLRPRMVLYNEFNPDEEAIGAVSAADLKSRPDAVIVVGTSLKIPGIRRLTKEMCAVARGRRGGFTAWINLDPEPLGVDFKDSWDLVVRGESDEVARYVGLPKWDDKDYGEFKIVTKEEVKANGGHLEVVVKPLEIMKGLATPGASPRSQSPILLEGLSKSKQSKLLFGAKSASEETNSKKKANRKPKLKVDQPKNKITNAFMTSKSTTTIAAKSAKSTANKASKAKTTAAEKKLEAQATLFPNLTKLSPVSPVSHRNNSAVALSKYDIHLPKIQTDQPPPSSTYDPTTPVSEKPYDREATISPRSKPSGMENLIL